MTIFVIVTRAGKPYNSYKTLVTYVYFTVNSPLLSLDIPYYLPVGSGSVFDGGSSARVGPVNLLGLTGPFSLNSLGLGGLGLVSLGLLSGGLVSLFGVTVEVQVGHDRPLGGSVGDDATQTQDLTGEQPPHQTDGVLTLVVARNSNVNVLRRRVHVAKSDHGDVDVRRLLDGLGVSAGVSDDNDGGLTVQLSDVVSEVTGGETAGNGGGTGVGTELQDGTLAESTGRADSNVRRVGDGSDDSGGQHNLLPGLGDVDHRDTIGSDRLDVRLLVHLDVLGAKVDVGSQQKLDVFSGKREQFGKASHIGVFLVVAKIFQIRALCGGHGGLVCTTQQNRSARVQRPKSHDLRQGGRNRQQSSRWRVVKGLRIGICGPQEEIPLESHRILVILDLVVTTVTVKVLLARLEIAKIEGTKVWGVIQKGNTG